MSRTLTFELIVEVGATLCLSNSFDNTVDDFVGEGGKGVIIYMQSDRGGSGDGVSWWRADCKGRKAENLG